MGQSELKYYNKSLSYQDVEGSKGHMFTGSQVVSMQTRDPFYITVDYTEVDTSKPIFVMPLNLKAINGIAKVTIFDGQKEQALGGSLFNLHNVDCSANQKNPQTIVKAGVDYTGTELNSIELPLTGEMVKFSAGASGGIVPRCSEDFRVLKIEFETGHNPEFLFQFGVVEG